MKTTRTFGVEMELNGRYHYHPDRPDVISNMPSYHSHYDGFIEIPLQPGWSLVYDSSCGSEFVSPPLCDTTAVMLQIDAIMGAGLTPTFDKAGLHIHVGAHDLSRQNLLELAKFCRHFERAIYSFVHPSRIKDEFCQPMQLSDYELSNRYSTRRKLTNDYRYVGCNITSYDKHGTVEYRYSEGTMDYGKIRALIDLFTKMTDWVASHKGNIRVNSPRKKVDKRLFLLDLVEVTPETRTKLINTRY